MSRSPPFTTNRCVVWIIIISCKRPEIDEISLFFFNDLCEPLFDVSESDINIPRVKTFVTVVSSLNFGGFVMCSDFDGKNYPFLDRVELGFVVRHNTDQFLNLSYWQGIGINTVVSILKMSIDNENIVAHMFLDSGSQLYFITNRVRKTIPVESYSQSIRDLSLDLLPNEK